MGLSRSLCRTSSTELTCSDDGKTRTWFSLRLSSCASSSQATAVRTRESSVVESRLKSLVLVLAEDLAGAGHDLAAAAVASVQGCAAPATRRGSRAV